MLYFCVLDSSWFIDGGLGDDSMLTSNYPGIYYRKHIIFSKYAKIAISVDTTNAHGDSAKREKPPIRS